MFDARADKLAWSLKAVYRDNYNIIDKWEQLIFNGKHGLIIDGSEKENCISENGRFQLSTKSFTK